MALIEETPKSLRLYFGIVAAFSLYAGSVLLAQTWGTALVLGLGLGAINLGLGLVFGYIVYDFYRLLMHRPGFIKGVLIANFVLSVAIFLISSAAGGMINGFFRFLVAVVIFVYLMKSVSRLSQELAEDATEAAGTTAPATPTPPSTEAH